MKDQVLTLRRTLAFSTVGAMGILVQLVVLWLLAGACGMHYLLATLCATEAAILHNFVWHLRWTWRDRPSSSAETLRRLWRFHAANGIVSLTGNLLLMGLLAGVLGIHYLAANLLSVGLSAAVNLMLSEIWVFRRAAAATVIAVAVIGAKPAGMELDRSRTELAELRPNTAEAFRRYVADTANVVADRVSGRRSFLWVDESPERLDRVRRGEVVIEPTTGNPFSDVPDGYVHDWIGAVFIPGSTLDRTLAVLKDYDSHQKYYAPEVMESVTRSRDGDHFVVFIRLMKKKIITVILNTTHEVTYVRLDAGRAYSESRTTRVTEVQDAGQSTERELPPGAGHGFLWNLDSFWRMQERDGGVYAECQAVSLSRDIPWGLGWLVRPIIRDLPRESLRNTLQATRAAVTGRVTPGAGVTSRAAARPS